MAAHMQMAKQAGIGVLVLSWYPPGKADENGLPTDPLVLPLLDAAAKEGLKICLHIEPYKGRSAVTVQKDLEYAVGRYGHHPAYARKKRRADRSGEALPMFYVYDSYHTSAKEWSGLLEPGEDLSIRGTPFDAFMIFLMVEQAHSSYTEAGFDAFYTFVHTTTHARTSIRSHTDTCPHPCMHTQPHTHTLHPLVGISPPTA